ncbi:hypothetical protein [Fusobacterium sp. MFO224]|uniref:hypothetical protein n=1 Tax=Fusobacterium sp. MFO224 TaxID=3378070 RepID=UPI0038522BBB
MAKNLTVYSRQYYRELDLLKKDIDEAEIVKIKGKKRILLKLNNDLKEYIFTEELKLEEKGILGKRDICIENIQGEFTCKDNLIFIKTKIKNERIDYVFFKR